MKNLSLAMLIVTLALSAAAAVLTDAATAAPRLGRFMVADQIANGPGPDQNQNGNTTAPSTSPSKKLSDSKGVIHPPPTGDHSVVTPPPTETTNKAVIPPPGTPGGDQTVQPK